MHDPLPQSTTPPPVPGTHSRGLVALLQRPDTPALRRTLIVLLVTIPVWVYVTTWDVLMMQFLNAAYGQQIAARDLIQMLLNNLLIFPLLFAAYFLAVGMPFRRSGSAGFFAKQIALGLAFSILARPAKITAHYLTSPSYASSTHASIGLLKDYYYYWQDWLAVTIQYSIVYLLGLMILLGINAFLRYKTEQLRTEQMRSRWLETKLSLLRGQLDPHFFFNALNIIVSFIRSDPRHAEKLLTELSTLMRLSLAESRQKFTTVQNEIEFVERYLAVMKARYENRLHISIALDPQTLDCTVPSFLLVPLVENTIKHGVDKRPGKNTVEITSQRSNGALTFTVKNSLPENGAEVDTQAHGMGLSNTRERLSAIYGQHYRLEAGPVPGGYWSIAVTVPVDTGSGVLAAELSAVQR